MYLVPIVTWSPPPPPSTHSLEELDSKFNSGLGGDISYSEDDESVEEEEEEEFEGYSSGDEDDPTVPVSSERRGRGSGSREGSSLSLRAQMVSGVCGVNPERGWVGVTVCLLWPQELEKQAEQELLALHKQKEMLTQLLEKQQQVCDFNLGLHHVISAMTCLSHSDPRTGSQATSSSRNEEQGRTAAQRCRS